MSVLISVYSETPSGKLSDTSVLSKSTLKNDLSCDVILRTNTGISSHNVIPMVRANHSFVEAVGATGKNKYTEIKDQFVNITHTPDKFNYSTCYGKGKVNLDNTVVFYNENGIKSPDNSVIANGVFSPYSYRKEKPVDVIHEDDSYFENGLSDFNPSNREACYEMFNRLREKFRLLKEEEARGVKVIEDINRERESKE
jgi:hypothetical protein